MPGHIGTSIVLNSAEILGHRPDELTAEDLAGMRTMIERRGIDTAEISDDQLRFFLQQQGENFRDNAPTTAQQAAAVILDGVRQGRWRILVGDDAHVLDRLVRDSPEEAYEESFMARQVEAGGMALGL